MPSFIIIQMSTHIGGSASKPQRSLRSSIYQFKKIIEKWHSSTLKPHSIFLSWRGEETPNDGRTVMSYGDVVSILGFWWHSHNGLTISAGNTDCSALPWAFVIRANYNCPTHFLQVSIRVTIDCQVLLPGFFIWHRDSHWNWVWALGCLKWRSESDTSCQILVSACYELQGNCPERSGHWPRPWPLMPSEGAPPSLAIGDHRGFSLVAPHYPDIHISLGRGAGDNKRGLISGKNNLRWFLNGSCLLFRLIPSWSLVTEGSHDSSQITSCIKAKYTHSWHSLTLTIYNQTRGKLKGWKSSRSFIKVHIFRYCPGASIYIHLWTCNSLPGSSDTGYRAVFVATHCNWPGLPPEPKSL